MSYFQSVAFFVFMYNWIESSDKVKKICSTVSLLSRILRLGWIPLFQSFHFQITVKSKKKKLKSFQYWRKLSRLHCSKIRRKRDKGNEADRLTVSVKSFYSSFDPSSEYNIRPHSPRSKAKQNLSFPITPMTIL